jgi:hypothetical protein
MANLIPIATYHAVKTVTAYKAAITPTVNVANNYMTS